METVQQENEIVQLPKTNQAIAIYQNASLLKIEEAEQTKLVAAFDEKLIEVRPDGMIYLPQVFWRQRLNQSFGIGQWCLVPKSQTKDPAISKLYIEGVLMVRGCYMATAVGEAEYHEDNKNQSWASVWESAKSDCITRLCKDLGIASELWQPEFIREWVKKYAVQVFVDINKGKGERKIKPMWRKKTTPAFWNETGFVPQNNQPEQKNNQQKVKTE